MMLRLLVFTAVFVCFSLQSRVDSQPHSFVPAKSSLILAQASAEEADVPPIYEDPYSATPALSLKDCASYGSEYGYPECADVAPIRSAPKSYPYPDRPAFPLAPYFEQPGIWKRATPGRFPRGADRSPSLEPKLESIDPSFTLPRNQSVLTDRALTKIVGRLMIVAFEGTSPPDAGLDTVLSTLKSGHAAGVLIRSRNVVSPPQLRALTSLLRAASETPVLIAIEWPGTGITYPSKPGFKMFPAPREMGNKDDALAAFNAYRDMANELSSVGVNINIGPEANVCRQNAPPNSNRCFGTKPRHAASFGSAFNFAHNEWRVLTAMRFDASSAMGPSLEMMREMMMRRGPDILLVSIDDADSIREKMIVEGQDSFWKAGFNGSIIYEVSDRSKKQSVSNALVSGLASGGEMILVSTPREHQSNIVISAVKALRSALESGQLSEARILNAYKYAQHLKQKLEIWESQRLSQDENLTSSINNDGSH